MSVKINITGEMSQKAADQVQIINAFASFIFRLGVVSSLLIVSMAYFYCNVLK